MSTPHTRSQADRIASRVQKFMDLQSKPAGTLGVLERYTGTNRIPIGRFRSDGAIEIVASVNGGGGVEGETDGDKLAALFAAAPELRDALAWAVETLEHLEYAPLEPEEKERMDRARELVQ